MGVTWLIHMCAMTLIYICDMTQITHWSRKSIAVEPVSWMGVTWIIHMCAVNRLNARPTSSKTFQQIYRCCTSHLIIRDTTHSWVCHDTVICVTWLIHSNDKTIYFFSNINTYSYIYSFGICMRAILSIRMSAKVTEWQRRPGFHTIWPIFSVFSRVLATNARALLQKTTCTEEPSYGSPLLCTMHIE